jgi:hypothetical protein
MLVYIAISSSVLFLPLCRTPGGCALELVDKLVNQNRVTPKLIGSIRRPNVSVRPSIATTPFSFYCASDGFNGSGATKWLRLAGKDSLATDNFDDCFSTIKYPL